MIYTKHDKSVYELGAMGFVALFLMAAGVVAFMAIGKGGLPEGAGEPADPEALNRPIMGIPAQYLIYGASFLVVPVIAPDGAIPLAWLSPQRAAAHALGGGRQAV